jgi:hypothetical protein
MLNNLLDHILGKLLFNENITILLSPSTQL